MKGSFKAIIIFFGLFLISHSNLFANTITRSIASQGVYYATVVVTITVTPDTDVTSYTVKEFLPVYVNPIFQNENGAVSYENGQRVITWTFSDNVQRELTYWIVGNTGSYSASGYGTFSNMAGDLSTQGDTNFSVVAGISHDLSAVAPGVPINIITTHYTKTGLRSARLLLLGSAPSYSNYIGIQYWSDGTFRTIYGTSEFGISYETPYIGNCSVLPEPIYRQGEYIGVRLYWTFTLIKDSNGQYWQPQTEPVDFAAYTFALEQYGYHQQKLFLDYTYGETPVEFKISTTNTSSQINPSVCFNGTNYFVAWQYYTGPAYPYGNNLLGQLIDNEGIKSGSEIVIPDGGNASNPTVSSNGNNFLVSWMGEGTPDSAGIYGRMVNSDGSITGNMFLINTYTSDVDYELDQRLPAIESDGINYIAAWQSHTQDGQYWGVFGQILDSTGSKSGSEFQINTYTTHNQCNPKIAFNGNIYSIVWTSHNQDGNWGGIYTRFFDNEGTPITNEILVNTTTIDYQIEPSVTSNGDNFIITWSCFTNYGNDRIGIYAQIFDNDGAKFGNEFVITDTASSDSQIKSVGNYYIAVWENSNSVYAQMLDNEGISIGQSFKVNTYNGASQKPALACSDDDCLITYHSYQDISYFGIYGKFYQRVYYDDDNDGILNFAESSYGTNPQVSDSDNDNVSDYDEIFTYFTNPLNSDTDNDTYSDGEEIFVLFSDPLDPLDPGI